MKCKNCRLDVTWDEVLEDYVTDAEEWVISDWCYGDVDGDHDPIDFEDYYKTLTDGEDR